MKINKIYLNKFKKYSYGYLFSIIPYKENKQLDQVLDKLIALDYLEI